MGLDLFRAHVMVSPGLVCDKTLAEILNVVERDRLGDSIDRVLLKNLLRMFGELNIYYTVFEKPFLAATSAFYAAEGRRLIGELEVAAYLVHVETRLQQESDRVLQYLQSMTRKPLVNALETQLLQAHRTSLLERGFDLLMDQNQLQDLRRLYTQLARINGLDELRTFFGVYIKVWIDGSLQVVWLKSDVASWQRRCNGHGERCDHGAGAAQSEGTARYCLGKVVLPQRPAVQHAEGVL